MKTVPDEIKAALDQDYGYILLIKGKAGTGKTTLALELLSILPNPIYISTRINPPLLYKQFPWIKEKLLEENIIDATVFDFAKPFSLTDELFLQSFNLYNLPDFVKMMFSKMTSETGTVVIDSWSAIQILGEARWGKSPTLLANYIIDLVREKKYNLILVAETDQDTFLDYLVDGIVLLSDIVVNDRLVREIHPVKLRGIRINQTSYLFSLHDGRFQSFGPPFDLQFENQKLPLLIKDTDSKISSGIPDLDDILKGGYPKGSVILFEIEPTLRSTYGLLNMNMALNSLYQKRGIVAIPSPGTDMTSELKLFQSFLRADIPIENLFRIIEIGKERADLPPIIVRTLPETNIDLFYTIRNVTADLYEKSSGALILILFSLDMATFKFPFEQVKKDLHQIRSQIKKTDNILFIVGKIGDPMVIELQRVVDIHFVLDYTDHQITFYGKNPETPFFAVVLDKFNGIYQIKLIPIV